MLTFGERALLYALGREVEPGSAIVDAGCFLGGSTVCLALGASERLREPAAVVHSYDLFEVDYSAVTFYPGFVGDRTIGADLRPAFESVVGDLLGYVEVHAGDLLGHHWHGQPIDVLFVDVAKTWELNDHVMHEFFRSLVAGRSVVVQQDYIHEWLPWVHIGMQLLADNFDRVKVVPASPSVVFGCTRAIRQSDLPDHIRDIPEPRLEALFDEAVTPYEGEERAILECARAVMLAEFHGSDRAVAHLDRLSGAVEAPTERFTTAWGQVRGWAAGLPR
jgi:hypothetical protein